MTNSPLGSTTATPMTPASLPSNDNVNPYTFCVDLAGDWFLSKGAMIAYYGQMRFEALTRVSSMSAMVAAQFSSPLYVHDWVVASGHGKLILGDRGFDINSYDLDDGNLSIRANNLLAFEPSLSLKQSIVPGFLTLLGTGKFLASSNGPVIFREPPLRVDPQALVGWADCPSPAHHFDAGWMESFLGSVQGAFGRQSGEEQQFDFTGAGTVLLQSSEQMTGPSGLFGTVRAQAEMLSNPELSSLRDVISARLAQQQY